MTRLETLEFFAKEINKDWTSEYYALIQDGELRIQHNHMIVLTVDHNFDIEIVENGFDDVVEQLKYMITR